MASSVETFEAWDPPESTAGADPGILVAAQRREIANILRSYTGYYDLFSELLQNALDAVEKRMQGATASFAGAVWINIDLGEQTVQVTDNGCAMDLTQLQQFLRPNFSFKSGAVTRGRKGVGATYLGYGFNSLRISSRLGGKTLSGHIENGRTWVEDITGTISRPKIVQATPHEGPFEQVDQGTSVTIKLRGQNIRPRDLTWYQATTAKQWLALLRIMTPAGGIYLNGDKIPDAAITVSVTDQNGHVTESKLEHPNISILTQLLYEVEVS